MTNFLTPVGKPRAERDLLFELARTTPKQLPFSPESEFPGLDPLYQLWKNLGKYIRKYSITEENIADAGPLHNDLAHRILIARLRNPSSDPEPLHHVITSELCKSFQSGAPSRTPMGFTVLRHIEDWLRETRSFHNFYREKSDSVLRSAEAESAAIIHHFFDFKDVVETLVHESMHALQRKVREAGLDGLVLYRGIRISEQTQQHYSQLRNRWTGTISPRTAQRHLSYRGLSSWTTDRETADTFALGYMGGLVVKAFIPVNCLVLAPGYGEEELLVTPVPWRRANKTCPPTSTPELTIKRIHMVSPH